MSITHAIQRIEQDIECVKYRDGDVITPDLTMFNVNDCIKILNYFESHGYKVNVVCESHKTTTTISWKNN